MMSVSSHSEIGNKERRYISARRTQIVEHMQALEEEHKILGDRLEALQTIEVLFEKTEAQIAKSRVIQKRIHEELASLASELDHGVPRSTQVVQAVPKIDVADAG